METKDIRIVFEHDDFVVIDKPAGILVHPSGSKKEGDERPTVLDWIITHYSGTGKILDPISQEKKCGIVHRLDKETSGIMVIAKHQSAFDELKLLFQNRAVSKTYRALLIGPLPNKQGTINLPIAKAKQGTKRTTRVRINQHSREAVTDYRILNAYTDALIIPGQILSYSELRPKAGRTHQLRVHCAAIGHPIAGDYLYGGKPALAYREDLGRIFLHAYSLEFVFGKSAFCFEAELPNGLNDFLKKLQTLG